MKKIIQVVKPKQKLPICVQTDPKTEEKPKNTQSVSLMLFWDTIPLVLDAYGYYCDRLNKLYSMNHNFIKCDKIGRQTKEIGK